MYECPAGYDCLDTSAVYGWGMGHRGGYLLIGPLVLSTTGPDNEKPVQSRDYSLGSRWRDAAYWSASVLMSSFSDKRSSVRVVCG